MSRFERQREGQQDAVLVGVKRGRKLDRLARVAHALKAAVGRRVRAPAGHPGDVELAVLGVEPAAVHAREKLAGQGDGRALGLAVDLLAQHEEMRARSEGEVEQAGPASGPNRPSGTVTWPPLELSSPRGR